VLENGQGAGQGQVRAKAVLSKFSSSSPKGGVHKVEQAKNSFIIIIIIILLLLLLIIVIVIIIIIIIIIIRFD